MPRQKLLCEKQILEEIDEHQGRICFHYQTNRDRYREANMACTGPERQTGSHGNTETDKRTHRWTDGGAGTEADRQVDAH